MSQIARAQMFPLLAEACPPFKTEWEQFLAEYGDGPEPFHYIAITRLARCLSRSLREGDGETISRVFVLLERFIKEGDHDVQETAVVGIIKSLQNAEFHDGTTSDQYVPFLLPETRRWWSKVQSFWTNGRLLTEA